MKTDAVGRAASPLAADGAHGFTLLEVVLALAIAVGLLVVVLYYYQQAARLRDSTLQAAAGLAAVRLCMDRLGTELRTASGQPNTFRGGPQEIEFLHCELPEPVLGPGSEAAVASVIPFALRQIRYALPASENPATDGGLVRTETLAVPATPTAAVEAAPLVPPDTNDVWGVERTTLGEEGVGVTASFPNVGTAALTMPELRYLRLRYWDGVVWQDTWSGSSPPQGVEITLALEAQSSEAGPDALPPEVFRRVIALPAGLSPSPRENPDGDFENGKVDDRAGVEARP